MKYSIGVDIGGTNIGIAVVSKKGEIIEQTTIPTDLSITPQMMIARINSYIKKVVKKSGVKANNIIGIGIGSPGPLDSKSGIIMCPPNLKTWVNVPIVRLLQETWSIPIILENDANAAAVAEKFVGAARDNRNFIYITISTGIGSGIFVDGKLLKGVMGNAGDIGHIVIDPSFGPCSCGQYGCFESIASGTAIAKRGSKIMGRPLSTKEVFDLYLKGNPKMVDFIEKIFRVIGMAFVSIINIFDTEKIIIGGGVSKVGKPLFNSIRDYVGKYALNDMGRQTEIVPAKLGQDAGVIGAAFMGMLDNLD